MQVSDLRWGDHVRTPWGEAVYCGPWGDVSHGFIHLFQPPGRTFHNLVKERHLSIPSDVLHLDEARRSWFYGSVDLRFFTLLTRREPCYTLP